MLALRVDGISSQNVVFPAIVFNPVLLDEAPTRALELYMLAAYYNFHDLAIAASAYLVSLVLSVATNEIALRTDPLYLKRLFF